MGREKVLLPLDGEPLVRRSVLAAAAVGAAQILVVVNPRNRDRIQAALADLTCGLVCNERFEEGIGGSIAMAAAAVHGDAGALLLMQADQPLIDAAALRRIIDTWQTRQPPFVASSFGGTTTTPVLFSGALIPELCGLKGDTGARRVLEGHAATGCVLAFPPWQGKDVDTDADYESVRRLVEREGL
jgi:molybdenum cofactor cytidylyltransferase